MKLGKWFCRHLDPEPLNVVPASLERASNYAVSLKCHECGKLFVRHPSWYTLEYVVSQFDILRRNWERNQKK